MNIGCVTYGTAQLLPNFEFARISRRTVDARCLTGGFPGCNREAATGVVPYEIWQYESFDVHTVSNAYSSFHSRRDPYCSQAFLICEGRQL